jgi:hypothetical protein
MSIMKKLGCAALLSAMLATGSVFAADQEMVPANPGDVITYGPGEGGGDGGGTSCYHVQKDIFRHADNVIRVGEQVYYRIRVKALCNLRTARLTDILPLGVVVNYVSSGCSYSATEHRVTCTAATVPAGAEATVYVGIRAANPPNRWIFNNACFSSALGGYMCHGIWTWIRPALEAAPAPIDGPREDLPNDNGFFPGSLLN